MSGARRTSSLAVALVLLVLVAACVPELAPPPRAGDRSPDLAGLTLAGDSLALSDLRGEPVLVNLWATWCLPCRAETPYLQSLYDRYSAEGLRMVGISVDDPGALDQVAEFTEGAGVTYDIMLDPHGFSLDVFQVIGLPATFVVDREGVIRVARIGPVLESDADFIQALEAALGR